MINAISQKLNHQNQKQYKQQKSIETIIIIMSPESSMQNREEESLTDIEKQVMEKEEINKQDDDDEESTTTPHIQLGCGVLGRYPIISLVTFVLTGILLGIGLSYWRPTDEDGQNSKAVALQWIGLVGDMFLRMLKCIVLPIVFVNVIIAVVDMMQAGQAGGVGGRTVLLYLGTTALAGINACIFSAVYMRWYRMGHTQEESPSYVTLGCGENSYLMEYPNGTVACSSDYGSENDILFTFNDVNGTLGLTSSGSVAEISLSDTIYLGIFETLIPQNIFEEFYNANFAAVIVFAIALGIAASKVIKRQNIHSSDMTFMSLLVEIDHILTVMIVWIIMLTPFAVLSLVAATIGAEHDLAALFTNMAYLIACILTCYITHFFVTYMGGYYLLTRRNPFYYAKHMAPAQLLAFACSSSAATVPLSTESVKSTGLVPDAIARFVIPLGATVNMDGACIQIVCSCIWLAYYNGIEVTIANFILLVIISTFGSMGTAPVPNAALALILTSFNTVFGTTGTPEGFSLLFAIDWFIDRCSTVLNVTGDMTVCGVIGSMVDMKQDGGRSSITSIGSMVDTKQDVGRSSIKSTIKEYQQSHCEVSPVAGSSQIGTSSGHMISHNDDENATHKSSDLE